MINCKNCGTDIISNFCPNCGQPAALKRIDARYIAHEIEHVLHFERGILYTIRELITTPGKNVRKYISENRSRLVKPIIFIIVTSLIYSIVSHYFHVEDKYISYYESRHSTTGAMYLWIQSHYGYANIIIGLFIAFWAKLFFKKYGFNLFEIIILLCFTLGMSMLIYSVFAIIEGITHFNIMVQSSIAGLLYCVWSMAQFFDPYKIASYLKALAAYILGLITLTIVVFIIGSSIDLIFH
ncbi:DUF3667 domain-containing protein [Sphingobacterium sp. HMA12]|uniref:DUF3667 domain-containing protein n=1 Tax=Sphingobacterium sp. HMA12 TaxID=2050894 RepID=UPI001F1FB010|nr:DUF3667 domain-containing protein [Sphingobacterium sp. HMA12]